jgi:hypothetical protein
MMAVRREPMVNVGYRPEGMDADKIVVRWKGMKPAHRLNPS